MAEPSEALLRTIVLGTAGGDAAPGAQLKVGSHAEQVIATTQQSLAAMTSAIDERMASLGATRIADRIDLDLAEIKEALSRVTFARVGTLNEPAFAKSHPQALPLSIGHDVHNRIDIDRRADRRCSRVVDDERQDTRARENDAALADWGECSGHANEISGRGHFREQWRVLRLLRQRVFAPGNLRRGVRRRERAMRRGVHHGGPHPAQNDKAA